MNAHLPELSPADAEKLMRMPSALVAHTVTFAVARGVPWDRITAETGLKPTDLIAADTWLPGSVVPITWRLVAELCPGEAPALDLARAAPLAFMGEMAPSMRFGSNLRQVLELAVNVHELLSDGLDLALVENDDEAALRFAHVADALDRGYGAEAGLGVMWRLAARLLEGSGGIRRVEFTHQPNGPEAKYVDFFRAPVRFGRPTNALVFEAAALDRPFTAHDPTLFDYVRAHIEGMRAKLLALGPADGLAAVRRGIERIAERGDYSAESLARQMGMSLRSLQRHVGEHDTTVTDLLETARRASAEELLGDGRLSIDEVAEAVGYADRRAFSRAFKRWSGQTPAAFRKGR